MTIDTITIPIQGYYEMIVREIELQCRLMLHYRHELIQNPESESNHFQEGSIESAYRKCEHLIEQLPADRRAVCDALLKFSLEGVSYKIKNKGMYEFAKYGMTFHSRKQQERGAGK